MNRRERLEEIQPTLDLERVREEMEQISRTVIDLLDMEMPPPFNEVRRLCELVLATKKKEVTGW